MVALYVIVVIVAVALVALAMSADLQTLVEVAVDKNSTVVFPAPLMSTIAELGAFLNRETEAAASLPTAPPAPGSANGGRVTP